MDFLQASIPRLSELSAHLLRLPTSDRGALAGLTSISDIQAWTKAKADEYHQLAFSLLTIHNLASPIHRLPTEVLTHILEQCWVDRKSFLLSHVCRLWRSILLGRPGFWANTVADCQFHAKRKGVQDDSQLPFINALLARSTQHSRTIKLTFFGFTEPVVEALTPYKNNLASLHVTVAEDDLNDGLWPLLHSGMPNLRDLAIHIMIVEYTDSYMHHRALDWVFQADLDYGDSPWEDFATLSRETLPRLSCLMCPPNMLDCFGDVVLKQLKVEWWDRSLSRLIYPTTDLGGPYGSGGFNLKPYCDTLETLEIRPLNDEFTKQPSSLEFPSLHYLHLWLDTSPWCISPYFLWITFPPTTCIRISAPRQEDPPEFYRSLPENRTLLERLLGMVDRVMIHQPLHRKYAKGYHLQCFSGDVERLRMDDYLVSAQGLLAVFRSVNAPVTHLTLSPESGNLVVDLRAFPRLEHLAVGGEDMETLLSMFDSPSPCPSLTELVITCELAAGPDPTPRQTTSSSSGQDAGADMGVDMDVRVDTAFRKKCAALQAVLAQRASDGCHSRLTSLVLCFRPPSASVVPSDSDSESGSESSHSAEDETATAESDSTVWPSHPIRQLVIQALRELVDGSVVLKLVDCTGAEVAVDKM